MKNKFKEGEFYQTRNGSVARVYSTEGIKNQEIHGSLKEGDGWESQTWNKDGLFLCDGSSSGWDLIHKTEYFYCVAYVSKVEEKFILRPFTYESERDKFASTVEGYVRTFEIEKP